MQKFLHHNIPICLVLMPLLALITACTTSSALIESGKPPSIDPLVSTQWLSEHLDDPDLIVLDCTVLVEQDEKGSIRSVSGQASYNAGHIPSAGFADLFGDLSAENSALEFTLPEPEKFVAAMRALGVSDNSRVVLYDANYSVWAARVWWMLRWIGFDRVAVLNGGLSAWKAENRAISTAAPDRPAGQLGVVIRPELIALQDEVLAATKNSNAALIDAMPSAHYRGEFTMYTRSGHIPGATNMPAFNLLDEGGYFRSDDELDMMLDGDRDDRAITYCGGGVSASAVAFTMYRLGFTDVAVYMGSLQEWTANPANPMSLNVP